VGLLDKRVLRDYVRGVGWAGWWIYMSEGKTVRKDWNVMLLRREGESVMRGKGRRR